ncbi:MAG TPA: LysR family transcriptional regulator [Kofleriaceae bacterium]|nr:LysR family transcriptional regulator [Kofleriaceae bacterium]
MKTELELRQLRVFATVVEVGSHTRAARALGISQSTVSETLSALERAIGVALFKKGTTKGSVLTPAGDVLLDYARRIHGLTSELTTELAKVSSDVSATFIVAAVESVSAYVLPSRLAALRAHWPKARLEVITGTCPEIRDHVAAGKCDLGLTLEAETDESDSSIVARTRFVIFGATTHPLAGKTATPDELRRCDFYMCDAAGNYHQVLRHYFEVAEVPVPRTQTLGTVEGVKRGISVGDTALGLLPAHAVEQELDDGSLVEVRVRPTLPGLVLRAVRTSGVSPLVDELIESLRTTPLSSY